MSVSINYLTENEVCFAAFHKNEVIYSSDDKGVRPIITPLLENKDIFCGCDIVDKVTGRASALLLVYAHIATLCTLVISRPALEVLESFSIPVSYEKLCDNIINRSGTDICPMEKLTLDTSDPDEAFRRLKEKIQTV